MSKESIRSYSEISTPTPIFRETPSKEGVAYKLQLRSPAKDCILRNRVSLKGALLRSIPFYGSFLGAKRIHSAWSAKDAPCTTRVYHYLVGGLELLGLGVVVLACKVLATALKFLFSKASSKIKQMKWREKARNLAAKDTVQSIKEFCSVDLTSCFTRCFRLRNRVVEEGASENQTVREIIV
ncbi:hypothetical protein CpB0224 [Chlamydia pneumoniae TW-183]|uniref:Uncharacterized protein n=3 Tax=Chlamydia pneumoniae TaxID=83558 RepID=Q9Z8W4_CHLPN|nr:hypothetical protein CPn_0220 [Chlamydia pneumoniae CWL029]AAF38367.1 hypothetical protein CP_0545 [Chlamydia pneumoniae AR39]AAP98157.1 hypothetical protein CpB0224 [Chlamydia pneumoniae TW-183]CRI32717.1 Uncharacterized protein BN1224_Wien1_A_02240 [Chlamydia pneumoniae]BAA98430.1 hypothetical protein [Chlamydia pneumoniae J138]